MSLPGRAAAAVLGKTQPFLPGIRDLAWQIEGVDAGVMAFEVGPERPGETADEHAEGAVVERGTPLVEVADQQLADLPVGDAVAVHEFGGALRAGAHGGVQRGVRWEDAQVDHHLPGQVGTVTRPA
ncbi:hypothetical protein KBI5_23535, partial [Frankia sp. KB5]